MIVIYYISHNINAV